MITDSYQRIHNYLRISLTDNCNMRCFYCMPEEEYEFTPASKLMQVEEIVAIAQTFVDLGVNKIRLTGGEPLVRKDAAEIILRLSKLPVKLSLTTNASRLHEFMDILESAHVKSLNISLDTLQPDKFLLITKRNQFELVKNNIDLAIQKGFHIKINTVLMRGINDEEIMDFISWTKNIPLQVRFIEFMPFTGNRWKSTQVVTQQEILEKVRNVFEIETIQADRHDTARAFRVKDYAGTFAVISTMSDHFCGNCNRMRLTADGKMKNCLFSKDETDLLAAYRNGQTIIPLIRQTVQDKYASLGGQMASAFDTIAPEKIENRSMITIGG